MLCLIIVLVTSLFGPDGETLVLIAQVFGHCLPFLLFVYTVCRLQVKLEFAYRLMVLPPHYGYTDHTMLCERKPAVIEGNAFLSFEHMAMTGSVRGSPNGSIGNFTNGTIGSHWLYWFTIGTNGITNGTIGRTLNDIGKPLVEP